LGFTHNFISEEAAGHVTLQLHPWSKMLVTVANGERVPCPGMYHRTPFTIGDEDFTADFFALPLAGYDVVLDTQCLASILWDFGALTMSFWRWDHKVCWRGIASPTSPAQQACSGDDLMTALLDEFATIFAEPTGAPGTTASTWFRGQRRWLCAPIATPPPTKT
jgi:hypothetical protein